MTAEGPDAAAKSFKRPRLDLSTPLHMSVQAAAPSAGGTAAAAAGQDGSALVAVPVVGDQMAGSDLIPALQQLLSVYQVRSSLRK
jgi:hypothetical protein